MRAILALAGWTLFGLMAGFALGAVLPAVLLHGMQGSARSGVFLVVTTIIGGASGLCAGIWNWSQRR